MKIGFWSVDSGQSSIKAMAAVAAITSLEFKLRVVMLQSHCAHQALEHAFFPRSNYGNDGMYDKNRTQYINNSDYIDFLSDNHTSFLTDQTYLHQDTGFDALYRSMVAEPISFELLDTCLRNITDDKFSLLTGSRQQIVSYEKNASSILPMVLRELEEYADVVFLDLGEKRNELTQRLIQEMDVLVVLATQDPYHIAECIEKSKEITTVPCFYLLEDYAKNSRYRLRNLIHTFHGQLTKENLSAISYSVGYKDALIEGRVYSYLEMYQHAKVEEEGGGFYQSVHLTAGLLLQLANHQRQLMTHGRKKSA